MDLIIPINDKENGQYVKKETQEGIRKVLQVCNVNTDKQKRPASKLSTKLATPEKKLDRKFTKGTRRLIKKVAKTDVGVQVDEDDIPESSEVTDSDFEVEYPSRAYWKFIAKSREEQLSKREEEVFNLKDDNEQLRQGVEDAQQLAEYIQSTVGEGLTRKIVKSIETVKNLKRSQPLPDTPKSSGSGETKNLIIYEDKREVGVQVEIISDEDLSSDKPSRLYWKLLAETKMKRLVKLAKQIDQLERENKLMEAVIKNADEVSELLQDAQKNELSP